MTFWNGFAAILYYFVFNLQFLQSGKFDTIFGWRYEQKPPFNRFYENGHRKSIFINHPNCNVYDMREREAYTYFNGIINFGSKEELKAQRPEYRDMKCAQTRQYKFYNNYIPFISQAP